MIQSTSPVAASPKWLRISGGRIFVPGSRPCFMPPRESQVANSTTPPPAVATQAISAAHSTESASFRPVPSIPAARAVKRTTRLTAPAVCDRCAAVAAEGLWREPDAWRRLATLVLGAVDQGEGPLDDVRVESVLGELLTRTVLLDIGLEHAVERRVGGKRVLVEL